MLKHTPTHTGSSEAHAVRKVGILGKKKPGKESVKNEGQAGELGKNES
ncbi:hypothetical protein POX_a01278 [Penicillium oxalicum]|uniref:Uncharacterized protein n=1 Tax=Penicillium oxalicum (strain 114-2 / CGMCC 5302) TaxID=933388 RepID=S7ZTH4_PENO1|nr:hypothetical protein POX_a01278 [Penicillium oxalicum]EPS33729.1 hypothetical protein PDE_08691 [Penicillium oxalicum 114-2]KAI2794677.1 hypothetical protein POX_a01278 [Penicillium oxalicum]